MALGTTLNKRYERLVTHRAAWLDQWQQIAAYILPRRLSSVEMRSPGVKQTERLFDSTAIFSNELLAASLQGTLTNQALKWFNLKLRDEDLNRDEDVIRWLQNATDKMSLAFRQSNFNSETHELYLDLGAFGTGAMLVFEAPTQVTQGFRGLLFRTIPVGDFVVAEDEFGRVDTIFYQMKMSVRGVVNRWGKENVSRPLMEKYKKDPDEEITVIHAVYPRPDTERKGKGPRGFPFASVFYEKETKKVLMENGFREFAAMVPRWTKSAGEIYGRGPGHTSLPDIKTLNKLVELELRALAKAVDPPLLVPNRGVMGNVRQNPGTLTIIRAGEKIEPLVPQMRTDVVELKKADLRQSIQQAFYVEQLLKLIGRETPMMTATEAAIKFQLLQQVLGPTFGRFETELLNSLMDRVFNMMFRAGSFEPPPDVLGGQHIDVEYEGPLAKGQRGQELVAVERLADSAVKLGQIDPTVLEVLDVPETFRLMADVLGAPLSVIRPREIVEERKAAREQQQAQEMEMNQVVQASQAAKNIGGVIKDVTGGGNGTSGAGGTGTE